MSSGSCQCLTNAGVKCSRPAEKGTNKCWQHKNNCQSVSGAVPVSKPASAPVSVSTRKPSVRRTGYSDLPADVVSIIAMNLPLKEIFDKCRVDRKFARACGSIYFWRQLGKKYLTENEEIINSLSLDSLKNDLGQAARVIANEAGETHDYKNIFEGPWLAYENVIYEATKDAEAEDALYWLVEAIKAGYYHVISKILPIAYLPLLEDLDMAGAFGRMLKDNRVDLIESIINRVSSYDEERYNREFDDPATTLSELIDAIYWGAFIAAIRGNRPDLVEKYHSLLSPRSILFTLEYAKRTGNPEMIALVDSYVKNAKEALKTKEAEAEEEYSDSEWRY